MQAAQDHHNAFQTERENVRKLAEAEPDKFKSSPSLSYAQVLERVGIKLPYGDLPTGVIKHHALDFIVEEIMSDGRVADITYWDLSEPPGDGPYLEMTLVKAGISTFDAVKELAQRLGISETQISYAGVKDAKAVTSQCLSVSGVKVERLLELQPQNYFLKDLRKTDVPMAQNRISGNRFTILVRMDPAADKLAIANRLRDAADNGFWNFYWTQRFGSRLLSHRWGLFILKNKVEQMVKSYLTEPGPLDAPFYRDLRGQALAAYGDWEKIEALFSQLPFTMRYELLVLKHLKEYRNDFVGAVRTIPEQVKFWTYAYASFLANRMMSKYAAEPANAPAKIPLILTPNRKEREFYLPLLKADGLPVDFSTSRFDFIRLFSRQLDTRTRPIIRNTGSLPAGLAFEFDLPKGAYATTFLAHAFTLNSERDAAWLDGTAYDLKHALGEPEAAQTIERLKVMEAMAENSETESE